MKIFKNFSSLKNHMQTIYFVIIGLFWISFFIWFRFFRKKNTFLSEHIEHHFPEFKFLLNLIFIVLHIFLILFAIYLLKRNNENEKKQNNILIKKFIALINSIFIKPLQTLRDLLAPHIPYSGIVFIKLTKYFEKPVFLKNDFFLLKIFVIIFNFLPRIIVSSIFFFEIILKNTLHYFFPAIMLLIIPLLWNIFINLYINFAGRALNDIPQYIQVIGVGEPQSNGWYTQYVYKPYEKYKYEENDIKEYADGYKNAISMYCFGTILDKFLKQKSPYILIFTSTLYLSSAIYKMIFFLN
jgi:hypothetical protein